MAFEERAFGRGWRWSGEEWLFAADFVLRSGWSFGRRGRTWCEREKNQAVGAGGSKDFLELRSMYLVLVKK